MLKIEIFKLFGSILVDSSEADKSISNTEQKAEGLGSKLSGGIQTAAKWGAAIVAGAAAAGAGMFALANNAAGTTDRIDKLSQKIGLSRQGFQEWEFILSQSGTDIEKLQVGLKTMTQRMDEVVRGTGKGSEYFEKLGVSVTDSTGALRSQEEVFEDTVRALQEMPEGAEKARLATELFGKAGQELMPLLNGATDSIDEMKEMAHDLGLVISDEAVDAGVLWTDTVDQMKRMSSALFTQIGTELMPIFQGMMEWVIANMPQIQSVIKTAFDFMGQAINVVVDIFNTYLMPVFTFLFDWVMDHMPEIQDTFQTIFKTIGEIIQAFVTLAQTVWAKFGDYITKQTRTIFDTVKTVIQGVLNTIKGLIDFWIGLLTGDWQRMGEGLKQIWQGLWQAIESIVRGAWNLLSGAFSALWNSISNWFKNLSRDALQWGKNMISGFVDGIKSMGSAVANAAKDTVAKAADYLKFWSPAKKGEGRFITQWGENMIDGFLDGVRNAIPDVEATFAKAIPNMGPTFAASMAGGGGYSPVTTVSRDDQPIVLEIPINLDGREIARGTAKYTNRELQNIQSRQERGIGRV